jgi:hypothetical protein
MTSMTQTHTFSMTDYHQIVRKASAYLKACIYWEPEYHVRRDRTSSDLTADALRWDAQRLDDLDAIEGVRGLHDLCDERVADGMTLDLFVPCQTDALWNDEYWAEKPHRLRVRWDGSEWSVDAYYAWQRLPS